ncbi:phage GP46 family protein, partial [Escherichia coli]
MADIAVVWDQGCGSLQLNGADLLTDNSLLTAVIISLFTDRRALDSDEIPDGTRDRRGWWGDSFRERPIGSRLWLLSREKTLSSVVSRAQAYADEALAWLHKSGAATSVVCHAMRVGHDRLSLSVKITLPDGSRHPMIFYADMK